MRKILHSIAVVVIIRVAPGLITLATLLQLGSWFSLADYAHYSTILATTGFVASMAFGPLTFSVVSQHAKLEAAGQADDYESSLISAVLLISALIGMMGLLIATTGVLRWAWIAPAITFGAYTAVQEILHARLRLWAYGTASLSQSIIFLVLAWVFIRPDPRPDLALTAFSASYAVATLISLLFSRLPCLRWPNIGVLSSSLRVGGPYTLGIGVENGLYLGMRYLILLLGTPQQLGVFSFCVDIAQRLIGFLINAASFVIIPTAFKSDAKGEGSEFQKTLITGAALALALALISFLSVLVLRQTEWISALNKELFDPMVFGIVSAAVVLNRTKKMVVDPVAMRADKAAAIVIGFAVSTPLTLALGVAVLLLNLPFGAELTYFSGYAFAAVITIVTIKRMLRVRPDTVYQ